MSVFGEYRKVVDEAFANTPIDFKITQEVESSTYFKNFYKFPIEKTFRIYDPKSGKPVYPLIYEKCFINEIDFHLFLIIMIQTNGKDKKPNLFCGITTRGYTHYSSELKKDLGYIKNVCYKNSEINDIDDWRWAINDLKNKALDYLYKYQRFNKKM